MLLKGFGKGNETHVSSNNLDISQQVVAQKGALEKVPQSIKWNEPKMSSLDIFAQNIEH